MRAHLTAVAVALMAEGEPVQSISDYPGVPGTDNADSEGEGSIHFASTYFTRYFGADAVDGQLFWNTLSGWQLSVERRDGEAGQTTERVYWLGKGLAPEPRVVAAFLTAAKVDLEGAGSSEMPVYRQRGEDLPGLTARLRAHKDEAAEAELPDWLIKRHPFGVFKHHRDARRSDAIAQALTAGGDTVRLVPLTEGEIKALGRLAEWADSPFSFYPQPDFLRHLADDLTGRYTRIGGTAPANLAGLVDTNRSARDAATAYVEKTSGQ